MDEAVNELREAARRNKESIKRLEDFVKKKTVCRSSLQGRAALPLFQDPLEPPPVLVRMSEIKAELFCI